MNHIKCKTRAKINLTLDVLERRVDGYHEVEMIMQTIDLYDEMEFTLIPKGISIHCDHSQVPMDEENIVYVAANLLQQEYQVKQGIEITIHKKIPVAAGLAGGSSNAAGTLQALNKLWQLDLPLTKLMELGKRIGADVPFCLLGGTALARGIGEVLEPLPPMPPTWLILVKPPISVSTAWAYQNLSLEEETRHPETLRVIEGIRKREMEEIQPYFYNMLEEVTTLAHPEIKGIKKRLQELGAKGVLMCGSGPTVFGLCKDEQEAHSIYDSMKKEYTEVFVVRTYNGEEEAI